MWWSESKANAGSVDASSSAVEHGVTSKGAADDIRQVRIRAAGEPGTKPRTIKGHIQGCAWAAAIIIESSPSRMGMSERLPKEN
jgi:hypothetical protein